MAPPNWKIIPWESAAYRKFVAFRSCSVPRCWETRGNAHHEAKVGHGGKSTKPGDERTFCLCVGHHDQRTRLGRRMFAEWKIDPERVILETQEAWFRKHGTKPWEDHYGSKTV